MFNKALFQYAVNRKNMTLLSVADKIGINPATLYRKMNGESDFTRAEMQLLRDILGLSLTESDEIFLPKSLRKRKKSRSFAVRRW